MATQTLDAVVTLPDGETIDVSHFAEYNSWPQLIIMEVKEGYLQAKKAMPLLVGTPEEYFKQKLGDDWAYILRLEDQVHKKFLPKIEGAYESGCRNGESTFATIARYASIDPDYRLSFQGKKGDLYTFRFDAYNHGQDPGRYSYLLAVRPTIALEEAIPL